jgi:hypothetical protein
MPRPVLMICMQIDRGALSGLHPLPQIALGLVTRDDRDPCRERSARETNFDDATWEDAEWQ